MTRPIDPVPYGVPDDRQLFFIHIPKTAGTSFSNIMEQYFHPDEICPYYEWWDVFSHPIDSLAQYRYIAGHFNYNLYMLLTEKPLMMTFLRNPIERALSHLSFLKNSPESDYWARTIKDRHSYRRVIMDDNISRTMLQSVQTQYIGAPREPYQMLQQLDMQFPPEIVEDVRQRVAAHNPVRYGIKRPMLIEAKKRLDDMFFFGLTDRFQESMHLLAYTMGWPAVTEFSYRRKSSNRLQWHDLEPDLQEKLREDNIFDFEFYKHAENLFDERYQQMKNNLLMQNLLDDHYQRRVIDIQPPDDHIEMTLQHVVPGTGWHPLEYDPNQGYGRWTGPGAITTLDVPVTRTQDVICKLEVYGALTEEILLSLRLIVNNTDVPLTHRIKGELHIFEGILTAALLARSPQKGLTRLAFRVSQTITPKDAGMGSDARKLGIKVKRVAIRPAASSSDTASDT